jgi:hypothetical protein
MPALNFTKEKDATPVAVVRGGAMDGSVLYLHPDDKGKMKGKSVDTVRYMNELRFLKPSERVRMMKEIQDGIAEDKPTSEWMPSNGDERIKEIYDKIKKASNADTSIELDEDGLFVPIPNPDPTKRQIYYAAGASGSGKSWFARQICENYKKLFPDREIYLISKLQEDETLDTMKIGRPKRIDIQSLVDDYPDLDEFKDCCIVFDDFDTLSKPYDAIVLKLIEDLAIMGRHSNTTMVICSHFLSNYKKTRLILAEAQFLVFYPAATSFKALRYVAEHYAGLSKEETTALKKLGRWTMVHKNYPQYLISAKTARLLNQ